MINKEKAILYSSYIVCIVLFFISKAIPIKIKLFLALILISYILLWNYLNKVVEDSKKRKVVAYYYRFLCFLNLFLALGAFLSMFFKLDQGEAYGWQTLLYILPAVLAAVIFIIKMLKVSKNN
ncbi:MAG: hypothetical protein GX236_04860 [Clostridiaceae bacterium]|jgi:peptidoglycan/LPS O-acetylase OafA/YrhL|nr:hypothetical protein [Clostridiaceae bacterium]